MSQNPLKVLCNQKDHGVIMAICTRKECTNQSAICLKCLQQFQKQCLQHFISLKDLPKKVNDIKNSLIQPFKVLELLINKLMELQKGIKYYFQCIENYEQDPNFVNINNLGLMIRAYENVDLDQILRGNSLMNQKSEKIEVNQEQNPEAVVKTDNHIINQPEPIKEDNLIEIHDSPNQNIIVNQNREQESIPINEQSLLYHLIKSNQPGKDYLLEPNSFYQGYFDVEKQIKYNYGKIILKQYDSHFNQSFFTYEGQFQDNKYMGNGKQFYGKSNVIQFEGEWNSQGRLEATGKFYDGAGTLIPNPNPKISKIKIVSTNHSNNEPQISPQPEQKYQQSESQPQSWCAFDQLYYEKDLKILQGTGWLNSSIIDGYINFLNYKDQKTYWEMDNRQNYNRMFIFASSVFSNFHENQNEMNQYNFKKEFLEYEPIQYKLWKIFKKIGMVINQNNSNWYFVIFDFKSKLMIIQDSIRGMKQHYKTVKNILEQLFSDQNEQINFEIQIDQKCLQQNNGYDCGTYVCLNAKQFQISEQNENEAKLKIDQKFTNPREMRKELYTFIKEFKDKQ